MRGLIACTTIVLYLATSSLTRGAEERCAHERAALAKIRDLELPAREKAIRDTEQELTTAVEESIGLDEKITAEKAAGAPAQVLDGYAKESNALRAKIERLKADVPKRKVEKAGLEERAVELDTRISMGCPAELRSKDDWQAAIGHWENKARTLTIELVDTNKANREYYPSEAPKIEGYVRTIPPTWPSDRVKAGDLVFISSTVEGNVLGGGWLSLPAKGECPKMAAEYSDVTLTVDVASQTMTAIIQTKQYWTPKCAWSDQVAADTIIFHRAR